MAHHEYCRLGESKLYQGIACNASTLPKLPDLAGIFKNCDVPCLQESWYIVLLLLLVPISAAVMFAMREYILVLVKGPGEYSEKGHETVALNTKPGPESQTCPTTEITGDSQPADRIHESGAASPGDKMADSGVQAKEPKTFSPDIDV